MRHIRCPIYQNTFLVKEAQDNSKWESTNNQQQCTGLVHCYAQLAHGPAPTSVFRNRLKVLKGRLSPNPDCLQQTFLEHEAPSKGDHK